MDQTRLPERLSRFKADLMKLNAPVMVQKHLIHGDCYALDQDRHFELKASVAEEFNVHSSEVLVVGSGKLGFSIVQDRRYRFFGDESDIDVAIVSPALFDRIWHELFVYDARGGYWPRLSAFKSYLFRGWIRPDKLPPGGSCQLGDRWWDFFRTITASSKYGPYKISAGLYKNWFFFESYQLQCVEQCMKTAGTKP